MVAENEQNQELDQVDQDMQEKEWARNYRKDSLIEQMASKGNPEQSSKSGLVKTALGRTLGMAEIAAGRVGKLNKDQIKQVMKGDKKRGLKGVKRGPKQNTNGIWLLAMFLAVTKDLWDISTMEVTSGVDWIFDIILGLLVFGANLKTFSKKNNPMMLLRTILPTVAESIPIVGFLPIWTFSVMFMWMRAQGFQGKEDEEEEEES